MKYKNFIISSVIALAAAFLVAASTSPNFIQSYWNEPAATGPLPPHEWSQLERNLSPESCAQCHIEQFDVWKDSLHAHAFSPGLIGQFPDLGMQESNDCLVCHAPLQEQKFSNQNQIDKALLAMLRKPEGFDRNGNPDTPKPELRHAGVTCAACHVRDWQRFGPPRRTSGEVGKLSGAAHNGFTGLKMFEQSQFCASCHQFPQDYAINGKPMENTVTEWQQSRFAREGVQCQTCHMPDRKHEFKGIHDPAIVAKGLDVRTSLTPKAATIRLASVWIGHAFPTYVTPKVEIRIKLKNELGMVLVEKQWEISRVVEYKDEWVEVSDTRLMPDEERMFVLTPLPEGTHQVHFSIRVIPDHFYKRVYRDLSHGDLKPDARKLLERAIRTAKDNEYTLFDQVRTMP